MIIKKKTNKVTNIELPVVSIPVIDKSFTDQLDNDLTMAAESFEENYKNFHSLIEGKVSASKLVDQLEEIGKDLVVKLKENSTDTETIKETIEFTKSIFVCIGERIQVILPQDKEPNITTPEQEHSVLKIGISSGILSGMCFVDHNSLLTTKEK